MTPIARQRGMTLIELLVAVAILVMIMTGVGYVFSQVNGAVSKAEAYMQINGTIRAASGQMRDDVQSITREGFICLVGAARDSDGNLLAPPALMFTTTGNFTSAQDPNIEGNAALVSYTIQRDEALGGRPVILGRAAAILAGPFDVHGGNIPSTPGEIQDYTTAVLADIQAMDVRFGGAMLGNFLNYFIIPNSMFEPFPDPRDGGASTITPAMNTNPYTINEVNDLWRYMAGGVMDMELAFYDGKDAAGNVIGSGVQELTWIEEDQFGTTVRNRGDANPYNDYAVVGQFDDGNGNMRNFILWHARQRMHWPELIRIRLTMQDPLGRVPEQKFDLILSVPTGG